LCASVGQIEDLIPKSINLEIRINCKNLIRETGPTAAQNWTNSSTKLDHQQHKTGPTAAQNWTNSSIKLDQQQHKTGPTAA